MFAWSQSHCQFRFVTSDEQLIVTDRPVVLATGDTFVERSIATEFQAAMVVTDAMVLKDLVVEDVIRRTSLLLWPTLATPVTRCASIR